MKILVLYEDRLFQLNVVGVVYVNMCEGVCLVSILLIKLAQCLYMMYIKMVKVSF